MKFGPSILLEIVAIVQDGFLNGKDVSQALRNIEVVVDPDDPEKLNLSDAYMKHRLEGA
jgi:hypothetical protein